MRTQRAIHPDGSEHWYELHSGPVVVGAEIPAAIIVARDPTETRRAKLALAESEARFRTLVEHAPEAIVVFDVDRRGVGRCESERLRTVRLTMSQLMQYDPVSLSPPDRPDGQPSSLAARAQIEAALAGKTPNFEWVHRTRSGRDVRCDIRLVRLPSADQRLVRGAVVSSM